MKRKPLDCCATMRKSFQNGTDNEGYGSLTYDTGDGFSMGCVGEPISYCPWCGTPVPQTETEGDAK
jgi:hypothetical protein